MLIGYRKIIFGALKHMKQTYAFCKVVLLHIKAVYIACFAYFRT